MPLYKVTEVAGDDPLAGCGCAVIGALMVFAAFGAAFQELKEAVYAFREPSEAIIERRAEELAREKLEKIRAESDSGSGTAHGRSARTEVAIEKYRYQGTWRGHDGHACTFVLDLQVRGGDAFGEIDWTQTEAPPNSALASRIGDRGTEIVEGTYRQQDQHLELRGTAVSDPTLLGKDRYRLKLSSDGKTISGTTRDHGSWAGTFRGSRIDVRDE